MANSTLPSLSQFIKESVETIQRCEQMEQTLRQVVIDSELRTPTDKMSKLIDVILEYTSCSSSTDTVENYSLTTPVTSTEIADFSKHFEEKPEVVHLMILNTKCLQIRTTSINKLIEEIRTVTKSTVPDEEKLRRVKLILL